MPSFNSCRNGSCPYLPVPRTHHDVVSGLQQSLSRFVDSRVSPIRVGKLIGRYNRYSQKAVSLKRGNATNESAAEEARLLAECAPSPPNNHFAQSFSNAETYCRETTSQFRAPLAAFRQLARIASY